MLLDYICRYRMYNVLIYFQNWIIIVEIKNRYEITHNKYQVQPAVDLRYLKLKHTELD